MNQREIALKSYIKILVSIEEFLNKVKLNTNFDIVGDYYSFIEQDSEKILNLCNLGIFSIEIFTKIKVVFKKLIEIKDDANFTEQSNYLKVIVNDLYYNIKFIYENILFQIENEFLVLIN